MNSCYETNGTPYFTGVSPHVRTLSEIGGIKNGQGSFKNDITLKK